MHLSSGPGLHVVLSLPSKACSLLSMLPRVLRWKEGFCCFFFPLNLCSFGVCIISQAKGSLPHLHFGYSSAGGTMDQRYKPVRLDLRRELARQSALDSLLKASLVLPTSHSLLCRPGSIPLLTFADIAAPPGMCLSPSSPQSQEVFVLLCLQSLLRYPMTTTIWAIPYHLIVL